MAMNRRGVVYLLSLGVVFLLAILSASMLMRSLTQVNVSQHAFNQASAFQLADAGLDQASINLRTADAADDVLTGTLPISTSSTGTYTILSVVSLDPQTQQVTSRGVSSGQHRDVEAIIRLTPESVFQFGLFGDQTVTVGGNASTDSYDSSAGPYDANNHHHDGDVGTNSAASGGVDVSGSIFVDGQIAVGPNVADPTSVVTGYNPSFITGNPKVVSVGAQFPMPDVIVPEGLTCVDHTVQGNTTETLAPPGPYCYHNLTVEGGAIFTASGAVKIYLTGKLSAKGNSTVGVIDQPSQMRFLMATNSEVTLNEGMVTGDNAFYGALYGPEASITVTGHAEVFGSIIAKNVNLQGSAWIHYDESLKNQTDISNTFHTKVVEWRDLD